MLCGTQGGKDDLGSTETVQVWHTFWASQGRGQGRHCISIQPAAIKSLFVVTLISQSTDDPASSTG
jgi:hypothetical protein